MAKQQSGFDMDLGDDPHRYMRGTSQGDNCSQGGIGGVGGIGGMGAWSQDDSRTDLSDDHSTMPTSISQLADAQVQLHLPGGRPFSQFDQLIGIFHHVAMLFFFDIVNCRLYF